MKITTINDKDLAELAGLYQQLQPNEQSIEKMKDALVHIRRNPNQIILGAKIEGNLIGTLLGVTCQMLFGQCKSFMVIEDVVVSNNYRRNGIGRALMKAIEKKAMELNCSYIMLITDHDRVNAHRFYESLGYKSDHYKAFKKSLI
ncbi:MAG TPA: GNAT family N-acetyltransferase [Victivallales bacterium]|nr:GNAT family N-acetyltransferase [Victivallales bacterium]